MTCWVLIWSHSLSYWVLSWSIVIYKKLTSCWIHHYPSALTVSTGCIVPKLFPISCSCSKIAFLIVQYTALLLRSLLSCLLMTYISIQSDYLVCYCDQKRILGPSGLGPKSESLQRSLSTWYHSLSVFCKKSKGLLQVYPLVPQRKHRYKRLDFSFEIFYVYACSGWVPVVSGVASSLSSVWKIVWFIVGTCVHLSIGSIILTCILAFAVVTRPFLSFFKIPHVWQNLRFLKVYLRPPPSIFGDSWCFELWRPLPSAFRNARCYWDTAAFPLVFTDAPLTNLHVLLIRQISCSCHDRHFWS